MWEIVFSFLRFILEMFFLELHIEKIIKYITPMPLCVLLMMSLILTKCPNLNYDEITFRKGNVLGYFYENFFFH